MGKNIILKSSLVGLGLFTVASGVNIDLKNNVMSFYERGEIIISKIDTKKIKQDYDLSDYITRKIEVYNSITGTGTVSSVIGISLIT